MEHYITVGKADFGSQSLDSLPVSYKAYYPLWDHLCPSLVARTLVSPETAKCNEIHNSLFIWFFTDESLSQNRCNLNPILGG